MEVISDESTEKFLANLQSTANSHSGKFDVVLADNIICRHNLKSSEKVTALLTGILRLLKPEGILILRENLGRYAVLPRKMPYYLE